MAVRQLPPSTRNCHAHRVHSHATASGFRRRARVRTRRVHLLKRPFEASDAREDRMSQPASKPLSERRRRRVRRVACRRRFESARLVCLSCARRWSRGTPHRDARITWGCAPICGQGCLPPFLLAHQYYRRQVLQVGSRPASGSLIPCHTEWIPQIQRASRPALVNTCSTGCGS